MTKRLFIFGLGYSGLEIAKLARAAGWSVAGTVTGADKAGMVKSATVQRPSAVTPPAGRVRPRGGSLLWLVDAAAGAKLPTPGDGGIARAPA